MRLAVWVPILALTLVSVPAGSAFAERRLALVIGNERYEELAPLEKAAADAEAYASVLIGKGFEVMLQTDVTRAEMDRAIGTFLESIQAGDTSVFVFSGHGWSDGSQNFLLGIDAPRAGSAEVLTRISVPLKNGVSGVLDDMDRRGARLKVAIVDACRDNPFQPLNGTRSVGMTRGLARIDPPRGTFVVFSAGAGQTALDRLSESDADPNSVFTRAFIPMIEAGLSLEQAANDAQQLVVSLARDAVPPHDQQPAYYDEVPGSTCLSGNCAAAVPVPAVSPVEAADEAAWARISGSTDPAVFEAFVAFFPDSPWRADAEKKAAALRASALAKPLPAENAPSPATKSPPAAKDLSPAGLDPCDSPVWSHLPQCKGKPIAKKPKVQTSSTGGALDPCRSAVWSHLPECAGKRPVVDPFGVRGTGIELDPCDSPVWAHLPQCKAKR